jgi:hypothetical protein
MGIHCAERSISRDQATAPSTASSERFRAKRHGTNQNAEVLAVVAGQERRIEQHDRPARAEHRTPPEAVVIAMSVPPYMRTVIGPESSIGPTKGSISP